jgi:hypothetical protein
VGKGNEALTSLLASYGLGELAPMLSYLYTFEQITDIPTLLLAAEDTRPYQERFAGIRDPRTGQKIMSEGSYIDYERFLTDQFTSRGKAAPSRAEVGAIVQSYRSPAELAQDFQAYDALNESPFVRDQFYLATGIDPKPEGLFAAMVGLAPDIEKAYQNTLGGIDQQDYLKRFTERLAHPDTTLTADLLASGPDGGFTAVDFSQQTIPRADRLRAVRQAIAANQARFQAGGTAGPAQGPSQPKPYTF